MERGRAKLQGFKRGISEVLLTHEPAANGVGLVLGQILSMPVRSEFERASQWASKQGRKNPVRYVMPDLWIKDDEHPKAIEVELTQKAEGRYKQLWDLYGRSMPYGA